jgi:energy-coupling factor transporter ATP-binding protein EcfA2
MAHLSLVKNLAQLQEEQKHIDEVVLDHIGLSLTRGSIVEAVGQPSSGKTSIALSLLAKLTAEGEMCAVVDAGHGFDACTASLSGIILENLLWVRCSGDLEKAFISADYLVQAKGFGVIWLNLGGLSQQKLRMVPKSYWYRYRTRMKDTPTLMLVTAAESLTGSASQQSYHFEREHAEWSGSGKFKLLRFLDTKLVSRKHNFGPPVKMRSEVDYTEV